MAAPSPRAASPRVDTTNPAGWSPAHEDSARTTRQRHHFALAGRERLVGAPFGVALLLAVIAIAVAVDDPRELHVPVALALLAAFVLAARVEFQTGAGYAVPTQIVFVPMVFALPAAAVPVVVGLGYVLARVLQSPRPSLGPERLVGEFANAWYAVAPALVITLAHAERPELASWPWYVAALLSQLLLDAVMAYLRSSLAFGTRAAELLPELWFAQRFDLTLAPLGFLAALVSADAMFAWLFVLPLLSLISTFGRERAVLIDKQLELASAYRGTAMLLGEVVEDDDEYTGRHSRGVCLLALAVADHLGLDDRARRDVEFGALLHDVGKVAMPKEIVNKPGPLTDAEWATMRTHTIEGERMLGRVGGLLGHVGLIVRASHERWDGSGYPDGRAGEAIPLAARIVGCVDAFSAMTTDRPYRRARSLTEALTELQDCAGTHFDPAVVAAVLAVIDRSPGEEAAIRAVGGPPEGFDRLALALTRALGRREQDDDGTTSALVAAVADPVVLFGADGRVRAGNAAAEQVIGRGQAGLRTALAPGGDLRLLDEHQRPLAEDAYPWQLALATGRPHAGLIALDRGHGRRTWLCVNSRPLSPSGPRGGARPPVVLCSLADVTDRMQVEEDLRELADRERERTRTAP